jgi:hypothetical protein
VPDIQHGSLAPVVYAAQMSDESILSRIESLVKEEHALQESEQHDAASEDALVADRERRERVSVELDRCWDLLRQRRARRAAGENPDDAEVRDEGTVEKYLQ